MAEFCGSTPDEWRANPHCYKYQADGVTINEAANACYSSYKSLTGGKHNTDPAIRDYDNGLWHHLVVTTRPDGQKVSLGPKNVLLRGVTLRQVSSLARERKEGGDGRTTPLSGARWVHKIH